MAVAKATQSMVLCYATQQTQKTTRPKIILNHSVIFDSINQINHNKNVDCGGNEQCYIYVQEHNEISI